MLLEPLKLNKYISFKDVISNRLLSIIQKKKILSSSSLYDDKAKILEMKVSPNSPLTGIPIIELGRYLPKDFLFAAIRNRGRVMIAKGDKVICPGDVVVLITHPRYTNELQKLF